MPWIPGIPREFVGITGNLGNFEGHFLKVGILARPLLYVRYDSRNMGEMSVLFDSERHRRMRIEK